MDKNGVVEGVYYCQYGRTQQLSDRMFDRNIPSSNLQMLYSIRPVSTKPAIMPILDMRKPATVPIRVEPTYNINKTFNPGSSAPWSGFATNVNEESRLRNQFFALQRCEQANYVPSSNSDLYKAYVVSRPVHQTHPLLFKQPDPGAFNPNPCNMGKKLFYNHTRQDVLNLPSINMSQKTYKW